MTLKTNTAEGGTNGTNVTAGNSGGVSGDAFSAVDAGGSVYSSAAAHGGVMSIRQTAATGVSAVMDMSDTAAAAFSVRFYLNLNAYPSAQMQGPLGIRTAANSSVGRLNMSATGQIQILMGTANATSTFTTQTLALGTWYRFEVYGSGMGTSASSMTCDVYVGDNTGTPYLTTTLSGQTSAGTVGIVRYGRISTAGSHDWYIDDIAQNVGTATPLGPAVAAPALTAAAAMAGDGALAAAGTPAPTSSAALTGLGALSAAGTPAFVTPAALTGSGALAATAVQGSSAAFTGSGTLSTTTSAARTVPAALTGSGALSTTQASSAATYRMYAGATGPSSATPDSAVSVGVEFYVTAAATLTEIRWWQPTTGASTATRQAALYLVSNQSQVATATAAAPPGTGWQTLTFATPVTLTANTRYRAAVFHSGGAYASTDNYYATGSDEVSGPLVVPKAANASAPGQGTYTYGAALAYPSSTFNSATYWVDVTVTTGATAQTASAALSGSGALSATVTPKPTTAATLTGAGALAATSGAGGAANAGPDQVNIEPKTTVTLTATGTGSWSQMSGTSVTLTAAGATATFTAPLTLAGDTLIFGYGGDTMSVTVLAATERLVIGGVEVAAYTTTTS